MGNALSAEGSSHFPPLQAANSSENDKSKAANYLLLLLRSYDVFCVVDGKEMMKWSKMEYEEKLLVELKKVSMMYGTISEVDSFSCTTLYPLLFHSNNEYGYLRKLIAFFIKCLRDLREDSEDSIHDKLKDWTYSCLTRMLRNIIILLCTKHTVGDVIYSLEYAQTLLPSSTLMQEPGEKQQNTPLEDDKVSDLSLSVVMPLEGRQSTHATPPSDSSAFVTAVFSEAAASSQAAEGVPSSSDWAFQYSSVGALPSEGLQPSETASGGFEADFAHPPLVHKSFSGRERAAFTSKSGEKREAHTGEFEDDATHKESHDAETPAHMENTEFDATHSAAAFRPIRKTTAAHQGSLAALRYTKKTEEAPEMSLSLETTTESIPAPGTYTKGFEASTQALPLGALSLSTISGAHSGELQSSNSSSLTACATHTRTELSASGLRLLKAYYNDSYALKEEASSSPFYQQVYGHKDYSQPTNYSQNLADSSVFEETEAELIEDFSEFSSSSTGRNYISLTFKSKQFYVKVLKVSLKRVKFLLEDWFNRHFPQYLWVLKNRGFMLRTFHTGITFALSDLPNFLYEAENMKEFYIIPLGIAVPSSCFNEEGLPIALAYSTSRDLIYEVCEFCCSTIQFFELCLPSVCHDIHLNLLDILLALFGKISPSTYCQLSRGDDFALDDCSHCLKQHTQHLNLQKTPKLPQKPTFQAFDGDFLAAHSMSFSPQSEHTDFAPLYYSILQFHQSRPLCITPTVVSDDSLLPPTIFVDLFLSIGEASLEGKKDDNSFYADFSGYLLKLAQLANISNVMLGDSPVLTHNGVWLSTGYFSKHRLPSGNLLGKSLSRSDTPSHTHAQSPSLIDLLCDKGLFMLVLLNYATSLELPSYAPASKWNRRDVILRFNQWNSFSKAFYHVDTLSEDIRLVCWDFHSGAPKVASEFSTAYLMLPHAFFKYTPTNSLFPLAFYTLLSRNKSFLETCSNNDEVFCNIVRAITNYLETCLVDSKSRGLDEEANEDIPVNTQSSPREAENTHPAVVSTLISTLSLLILFRGRSSKSTQKLLEQAMRSLHFDLVSKQHMNIASITTATACRLLSRDLSTCNDPFFQTICFGILACIARISERLHWYAADLLVSLTRRLAIRCQQTITAYTEGENLGAPKEHASRKYVEIFASLLKILCIYLSPGNLEIGVDVVYSLLRIFSLAFLKQLQALFQDTKLFGETYQFEDAATMKENVCAHDSGDIYRENTFLTRDLSSTVPALRVSIDYLIALMEYFENLLFQEDLTETESEESVRLRVQESLADIFVNESDILQLHSKFAEVSVPSCDLKFAETLDSASFFLPISWKSLYFSQVTSQNSAGFPNVILLSDHL